MAQSKTNVVPIIEGAETGDLVALSIGETTVWAQCECGNHRRVEHELWEAGSIRGCAECDPIEEAPVERRKQAQASTA